MMMTECFSSGVCKAANGKDCKFPFKWMGVDVESCNVVDRDLGWCATQVNHDGTFYTFEFCDGNCTVNSNTNLLKVLSNGSPCCEVTEICYTADINPEVLGWTNIEFLNKPLQFSSKVPPNGYSYRGKDSEALFRWVNGHYGRP